MEGSNVVLSAEWFIFWHVMARQKRSNTLINVSGKTERLFINLKSSIIKPQIRCIWRTTWSRLKLHWTVPFSKLACVDWIFPVTVLIFVGSITWEIKYFYLDWYIYIYVTNTIILTNVIYIIGWNSVLIDT